MRLAEFARPVAAGVGEGPPQVAEEFAAGQGLGQGGAIDQQAGVPLAV